MKNKDLENFILDSLKKINSRYLKFKPTKKRLQNLRIFNSITKCTPIKNLLISYLSSHNGLLIINFNV